MSGAVGKAALLVLFPVAAAITGAVIATIREPSANLTSGVQHFAAGVVFAAVAGEVLPDIRKQSLSAVLIGFAAGVDQAQGHRELLAVRVGADAVCMTAAGV